MPIITIIFFVLGFVFFSLAIMSGLCFAKKISSRTYVFLALGFLSYVGCMASNIHYKNALAPVREDISKIEKEIDETAFQKYFEKFCNTVNATEYSKELNLMRHTHKSDKEIWNFCKEKLTNHSIYKEIENDTDIQNLKGSMSILEDKVTRFNKIYFYFLVFIILVPIIHEFLIWLLDILALNKSEQIDKEKKIEKFISQINS